MNARQKAKYYKQKYEKLSKAFDYKDLSIIEIRKMDVRPYFAKSYINPDIPDEHIRSILAEQFLPAIKENMDIKCYEDEPLYSGIGRKCLRRHLFAAGIYIGKYEENT